MFDLSEDKSQTAPKSSLHREGKKENNVPFWSKVEKGAKERPKTSLGPGYYNIDKNDI